MPKVLIKCYADADYAERETCLCIDVDSELAKQWITRIETTKMLRENDDNLYSVDYWECHGDFFDLGALDASVKGIEEIFEDLEEDIVVLDPNSPAYVEVSEKMIRCKADGGARTRTETDLLEVAEDHAIRCGYVKHTSIRVESVPITASELRRFVDL